MRYDLLFERFLNPARKDMPDMDLDFAVEGRERVINYVDREVRPRPRRADHHLLDDGARGGARRGACSRSAYGVVDRIAKLIPEARGRRSRRHEAGRRARERRRRRPVAQEIVELARPLEGLTRADSIHAAGVVIGASR